MMRLLYILILYSLIPFFSFAQVKTDNNYAITINKDPRLDELIHKQKEINFSKQSIPGYRVQVYFGGDRQKANDLKQEFVAKHPDMNAYVTYQQPNFKVRVGDFRTRLEAQKFLKQIGNEYSSCFIVPEDISIKSLP
jgi:hypothetical protein